MILQSYDIPAIWHLYLNALKDLKRSICCANKWLLCNDGTIFLTATATSAFNVSCRDVSHKNIKNKEKIHRMTLSTLCQWLVQGVQDWMTSKTKRLTHLRSQSLRRQCSGQGCCGFSFQSPWKPFLKDGLAKSLAVYTIQGNETNDLQASHSLVVSANQIIWHLQWECSQCSARGKNQTDDISLLFWLIFFSSLWVQLVGPELKILKAKTNGLKFEDDFPQCLQINW